MNRIHERLPRLVWLNPEPIKHWDIPSTWMIRQTFEMYPLTLDGLEEALGALLRV